MFVSYWGNCRKPICDLWVAHIKTCGFNMCNRHMWITFYVPGGFSVKTNGLITWKFWNTLAPSSFLSGAYPTSFTIGLLCNFVWRFTIHWYTFFYGGDHVCLSGDSFFEIWSCLKVWRCKLLFISQKQNIQTFKPDLHRKNCISLSHEPIEKISEQSNSK